MNATPKNHAAPPCAAVQKSWLPSLLIMGGIMLLPGMDAIAKGLTGLATVSTISFFRNATQVALMALPAWRESGGALWPLPRAWLHMLRGLLMVATGMAFFAGVQRLPLADCLTITFVYPFLVACMSPLLLGEHLQLKHAVAIVLGFVGTLIIIRPGSGVLGHAALLPLVSAVGYAGYVIVTRKLAQTETPTSVLQFWMGLFGSLWVLPVFGLAMVMDWPQLRFHLTGEHTLWAILVMGLLGSLGHWMITKGARHVSANVQAGLGYAEIITATLLGWLIWRDFPDLWSWLGISIVIGSGLWLMRLQTSLPSQG
jgi:drug/metabolite transporter (DMT)-like permease